MAQRNNRYDAVGWIVAVLSRVSWSDRTPYRCPTCGRLTTKSLPPPDQRHKRAWSEGLVRPARASAEDEADREGDRAKQRRHTELVLAHGSEGFVHLANEGGCRMPASAHYPVWDVLSV